LKNRFSFLPNLITPIVLFSASLGLYVSTLAPGILRGDSGEFQWAMASLNVPHATGYPLFTLLGYGWLQIPLAGAPAWRLNLLAAIFGAGAVTFEYGLARAITRRIDAALVSACFFALAPVFWFNSSILEVYGLNALLLGLILLLLVRWSNDPQSTWPLYLAFFFLGLGLAHHRMMALAIPGIAAFVLLIDHSLFSKWRRLFALVMCLLPGLALYLYVPLRLVAAGQTLHYAIFDIILGQEFSASLFREYHPEIFWQIPLQNFQAGTIVAILGTITLFRRNRDIAILLLMVFLADLAFALVYWVPDVAVFLTPSFVIIAVWIAAGTWWIVDFISSHLRPPLSAWGTAAASLILVLVSLVGLEQYPSIQAQVNAEAGTAESRARAILDSALPRGALLELDWETATALRFIQTTEGVRQDLEARLIKLNQRDEYLWALKNVDSGRAVFVERGVNWTRAPADYVSHPAQQDLAQISRQRYEAETVSAKIDDHVELTALGKDAKSLTLFWKLGQPLDRDLATFVHFFDGDGHPLGQEDHAPCCEAIYGYRTTEWKVGREIADRFNAPPAGTAYLQIGMYALENGDVDSYGNDIEIQLRPIAVSQTATALNVELGDAIVARAYELSADSKQIRLTVYWQARHNITREYTGFVHVLDASGKVIRQVDREPVDGAFPTTFWKVGETVRDSFVLPSANGQTKLEFGLYDTENGQRLTRADGEGDTISIAIR
jgi:Protein O-mannosyl-transferase TMEM260-like